uniref:Uncharacterized protein n=1 Tax=Timema cristinae TaxID=61476 RepID=A0A7R9H320_TIMCR|nr:unnamed protein product [Timema cristinae]
MGVVGREDGKGKSLRGLSVGDQPPREQAAGLPVKLSAGADLLHKYQTDWSEIHKQSEENAHQAQVVDSVIARLHHTCEKQSLEIVRMSTALANLPQLIDSVQLLMDQIASLQGLFEEVETGVLRLEDMIEIQELQEKQLEHRFQFALYKEKKLSELESLKVSRSVPESSIPLTQKGRMIRLMLDTWGGEN